MKGKHLAFQTIALLLGILWLSLISGCASLGTYNPATERREFIFISTPAEVSMGKDIHKQLEQQYTFQTGNDQWVRLQRVGNRLAQISDRKDYRYYFYLIEEDQLNAFTTPGGNIYVFTGLIDRFKTDDELASVLAHEIGHCAARHTIKKFQAGLGYNLLANIVLGSLDPESQGREIVAQGSGTIMNLVFSAYGRQDEYEADKLGVKYMYMADYDFDGMIKTLELLKKESKGAEIPLMLRSHPHLEDRIEQAKVEMLRYPKKER